MQAPQISRSFFYLNHKFFIQNRHIVIRKEQVWTICLEANLRELAENIFQKHSGRCDGFVRLLPFPNDVIAASVCFFVFDKTVRQSAEDN